MCQGFLLPAAGFWIAAARPPPDRLRGLDAVDPEGAFTLATSAVGAQIPKAAVRFEEQRADQSGHCGCVTASDIGDAKGSPMANSGPQQREGRR